MTTDSDFDRWGHAKMLQAADYDDSHCSSETPDEKNYQKLKEKFMLTVNW